MRKGTIRGILVGFSLFFFLIWLFGQIVDIDGATPTKIFALSVFAIWLPSGLAGILTYLFFNRRARTNARNQREIQI